MNSSSSKVYKSTNNYPLRNFEKFRVMLRNVDVPIERLQKATASNQMLEDGVYQVIIGHITNF